MSTEDVVRQSTASIDVAEIWLRYRLQTEDGRQARTTLIRVETTFINMFSQECNRAAYCAHAQ